MDFAIVAGIFGSLEGTSKRLELTAQLSSLLKDTPPAQVRKVVYLVQGRLVPEQDGVELGVGDKLCQAAIASASGQDAKAVAALYRKTGDLGDAAAVLLARKNQLTLASSSLTVDKVYDNFYKIATASGAGSQDKKVALLSELLSNATPSEAKVIVRFSTGGLRLGVAEPTIIDALSTAVAGDKSLRPQIERAFNFTNDVGMVAELFLTKGIDAINAVSPTPFSPIRPALAERLESPAAIVEKLGPCLADSKFDGFRVQVHKRGDKVRLYSRKLEPMTHMFPDLVEAVLKHVAAKDVIMEGEAIAFDESTNLFLPFQATIQRKRVHGVDAKSKELPLKLFAFELLYADGEDLTGLPFAERRKRLEAIITPGGAIAPSPLVPIATGGDLERFFDECIERGLEGIIAKDPNAPYTAGARKFSWIKFKRSYASKLADTVDAVVVGYYLGKGKRTEFGFGGFLTAVYDPESNRFKTIAKVGTGFTEAELAQYKQMLDAIKVASKPPNVDSVLGCDVWVRPQVVVTLTADELTLSPTHTCCLGLVKGHAAEGLALRFPRLTSRRDDKDPLDATTVGEVMAMYELQGK